MNKKRKKTTQRSTKRRKRNNKLFWVIGFVVLIFVLVIGFNAFYQSSLKPVSDNTDHVIAHIPEGSTLSDISDILYDEGLIRNSMVFQSYAGRRSQGTAGIQAANYQLSQSMSTPEIFTKLVNGESYVGAVPLTVPEGRNLKEMAPLFEEAGICKAEDFLNETSSANLAKWKAKFPVLSTIPDGKDRGLEGYVYADTYEFEEDSPASAVVEVMLKRFTDVYNADFAAQVAEKGKTTDEIVIMASIVELETKLPEDKADAASVFYNRIAAGMPLQSDITVDYARGSKTAVLTEEQTQIDSPYNTYINLGLPVGPICSPSHTSFDAAINPSTTDYLFFVADMESGKLHFNTTLEGHDQDVATYMGN